MKHTCDWKCLAILRARLANTRPAVWNSLTHIEQAEFSRQDHIHAESALFEENRPSVTERVLAFFRGQFTRRQYDAWKAKATRGACPTCTRPL